MTLTSTLRAALFALAACVPVGAAQTPTVFTAGDFFFSTYNSSNFFRASGSGTAGSIPPFVTLPNYSSAGQMAWNGSRTEAYLAAYHCNAVFKILPNGTVTTHATVSGPIGLVLCKDGRLLVASWNEQRIYDVTAGGAVSSGTTSPFALVANPWNLAQLADGRILAASFMSGRIYDISAGGNFTSAAPFAAVGARARDIVQMPNGAVFASAQNGIFNITGGGTVTTPYVTGSGEFSGLANSQGKLLASMYAGETTTIRDVTAGGAFSSAPVIIGGLPSAIDGMLDAVPGGAVQPPIAILGSVTNVSRTSADFSGSVNPGGEATTVRFETAEGTETFTSAGAQTAAESPLAAGSAPVSVSASYSAGRFKPGTTYSWQIVANNSAGGVLSERGTFTTTANLPPVADAGGPYEVREDATLTLDASGSSDPEGDAIVSYEWDFNLDGTADATGETVDLTVALRQEFGQVLPNKHTSRLRVTDTFGASHTATFEFTVTAIDPEVSVQFSKGGAVPGAGEAGSGIPAGSIWKRFGVPSINNAGTQAFVAVTDSPAGSQTRLCKVSDGSGQLGTVAEIKQQAPGAPAGVLFTGFRDPLLNARGDIAFVANLDGAGVNAGNNQALFVDSTDSDSDRLIAREGTQAADAPEGALWKNFNSVAFANESNAGGAWTLAISASMVTGPLGVAGPGGVSSTNDTGLWLADATRALLALREGQTLTVGSATKTVKSFYTLKAMPNAAGQGLGASTAGVPVQVVFTDSSQALLRVALGDPETESGVTIETLALSGDPIPGLDVKLRKLGLPTQSGSGDATVWISGLDTKLNPQAIVRADSAGGISPVVRKGAALSATEDAPTFLSFTSVAVNEEDDYAVLAKLAGPGVTSASDLALTRRIGAQPWEVIAREGALPPGTTAGSQWATFPSYAIADDGATVAFLGKLKVPKAGEPNPANVTNANDAGLWVALPGEEPQLLLREGDAIEGKTVRSFTALTAISGSSAQRRTFTPDGRALLIRVNATDGSQHMIIIRVPAPQKPREPGV